MPAATDQRTVAPKCGVTNASMIPATTSKRTEPASSANASPPEARKASTRVIRPGGRLFLSTPHAAVAARGLDPAWWVAGHRHYSRADVEALVRDAGFDVETLELRGGWWQQAYMLNLYVAKWVFRRRPFFEQRFVSGLDREWTRDGHGFAHVVARCRRR